MNAHDLIKADEELVSIHKMHECDYMSLCTYTIYVLVYRRVCVLSVRFLLTHTCAASQSKVGI